MRASILLLTPLRLELDELMSHFPTTWLFERKSLGKFEGFFCAEQKLFCAVGGHGKVQFALHTQYFLHHLEGIEKVICVGAAGSCTSLAKLGEVIDAEKTVEHDFNLKFIKRPLPEFSGDSQMIEILRKNPGVRVGIVASGDEDVIDPGRRQDIHELTQALAVAWEGAGGARACALAKIPYVEIRGITDQADGEAQKDFKSNLKGAMKNCALCLQTLMETLN